MQRPAPPGGEGLCHETSEISDEHGIVARHGNQQVYIHPNQTDPDAFVKIRFWLPAPSFQNLPPEMTAPSPTSNNRPTRIAHTFQNFAWSSFVWLPASLTNQRSPGCPLNCGCWASLALRLQPPITNESSSRSLNASSTRKSFHWRTKIGPDPKRRIPPRRVMSSQ